MANTVFWSWQSDQPQRETRRLIRDALSDAINRIAATMEESERPGLDHDTKNVPGSPEIVATILKKIDSASVFVADVTPISVSENGKHISNPNVLIELGYAKHALGTDRIILVWNTAITDCTVDNLPFDLRHRRGPISFDLPIGAPTSILRKKRETLSQQLEIALNACLANLPTQSELIPSWHSNAENDPSIWATGENAMAINHRHDPPVSMGFDHRPRAYARIIPQFWQKEDNARSRLENDLSLTALGKYSGLDWGRTTGGFIAYRASDPIYERGSTPTATRWFQESGEIWGIASSFFTSHDDYIFFSESYAVYQWLSWLRHSIKICKAIGGSGQIFCRLGVSGIDGTRWPKNGWVTGAPNVAVENDLEFSTQFSSSSNEQIVPAVRSITNLIRDCYGLDGYDDEEFEQEFRNRHSA